jgi:glutathione S-transferase
MPSYKLTYFNLGALAEPLRWAFKVAEVDFEDERIEREDWPALKKSGRFPTENLPLLEIDGEVYTQSSALLRYLGTIFGLTVEDPLLRLRLDQILDITADSRPHFRAWFMEADAEKKEKAKDALVNEFLPMYLRQIEGIVSKTEGPYIAGSKLTYGDLGLANALNMWLALGLVTEKQLQDSNPGLAKLREAVVNVPQIKTWLEVRPKTSF